MSMKRTISIHGKDCPIVLTANSWINIKQKYGWDVMKQMQGSEERFQDLVFLRDLLMEAVEAGFRRQYPAGKVAHNDDPLITIEVIGDVLMDPGVIDTLMACINDMGGGEEKKTDEKVIG